MLSAMGRMCPVFIAMKNSTTAISPDEMRRIGKMKKGQRRRIISFFPVDRYDCACLPIVSDFKLRMPQMSEADRSETVRKIGYLRCPGHKRVGMRPYEVSCGKCKATVAYCYATDPSLSDWCDLHYVCEHDGKRWYGARTVNISPVDGKLSFECCCGNDTRDFRANRQLPEKITRRIEEKNRVGRELGKHNSRFIVLAKKEDEWLRPSIL